MSRRSLTAVAVLFILAGLASPVRAEAPAWNIQVDSSFRAEYLFGRQIVRHLDPKVPDVSRFVANYDPQLTVLAGTIEITPLPAISGRLAGSISVLESTSAQVRSVSSVIPSTAPFFPTDKWEWDVKPNFSSWEAAGLYHLWSGGGYRFSFTAGYRQDTWDYRGTPSNGAADSPLHDSFSAHIPFIGMQTAMFFPSWKARFEMLGSPFMNMSVSNALQRGSFALQFDGNLYKGGMVELQMAGDVNLAANVLIGLYGRYAYQELYGLSSGTGEAAGLGPSPYTVFVGGSFGTVGLDVTVIF
ncbi:MAG: hypothetical protein ACLP5H_03085 [Desulfomonilaceae bacterium]